MKNLIFKITFLLLIFIHFNEANSQWVQRFHSVNNVFPGPMITDNSGNIYTAGFSGYYYDWGDFLIIKYSSSGELQWQRYYDGSFHGYDYPYSIGIDDSGNVYVCGISEFAENQVENILIKYNNSGLEKWQKKIGRVGYIPISYQQYMDMKVEGDGSIYVTTPQSNIGFSTIRFNLNGDSIWVNKLSSDSYPRKMAIDSGNVYVSGMLENDIMTIKYSKTGEQLWIRSYDGVEHNDDLANTVDTDDSGNVYVSGVTNANVLPYRQFSTLKYDKSGLLLWVRSYNADYFTSSTDVLSQAVDDSGNVYISGQNDYQGIIIKYNTYGTRMWFTYQGSLGSVYRSIKFDDFDNVFLTGRGIFEQTNSNLITYKYSPSGLLLWSHSYGGNYDDEGYCLVLDNSGNVIVTGTSIQNGSRDIVTIKYQNQSLNLNLSALIDGLYDNLTNSMISDTVRVYLRSSELPYSIMDSTESILNSNGNGSFNFSFLNNAPVYIVVKHRNTIETWSNPVSIDNNPYSYDFTTSQSMAYGNNLLLKGIKYCLYSGDIDQDGNADLIDLYKIYNDAVTGVSGYVNTDINGDNFVDLDDVTISYNNMNQFVKIARP